MCAGAGLVAVEPLFGSSTLALFEEWTSSGADALIVTARADFLGAEWLGRPLRLEMLESFQKLGVDPCGERGEYHTVVTSSPLFSAPLELRPGPHVLRTGCWALDFTLAVSGDAAVTGLES
jgi:diphthine-ammonia ligase